MTTYPQVSDSMAALSRADGTTKAHSDDHGRIIGMWENVKHHGAKGDGATDDTAAIQAAITAAGPTFGTVFFPPGTYFLADGSSIVMGTGVNMITHGYVNISFKNAYAFTAADSITNIRLHGFACTPRSGSTSGGVLKTTGTNHNGWDISNMSGGGGTSSADPAFQMNGFIGARMAFCEGNNSSVGYYWSPAGWFCNSNTMYRCRAANAANTNTFQGTGSAAVNANLYAESAAALKVQDCIFEAAVGYGTYLENCNSATLENNWYEANEKDHVHVKNCQSVRVQNCKFHYQTVGDPTADHIELERSAGGFRDNHQILSNHFADPSTSGVYLRIGTNVEDTVVIGNRDFGSTDVVDSGTRTLLNIGGAGTAGGGFYAARVNVGPYSATGATPGLMAGSGSPEGSITAPIGSLYMRTNGGASTSLYVKESGTGNTGWVGK